MRKNVVKFTDTALHDIENIHDYIAYEEIIIQRIMASALIL